MISNQCEREAELLDALGRGFVPEELTRHVDGCPGCGELQVVAGALLSADPVEAAPVPSAGAMWWRMQLRQRGEAQRTTRHSLLIGQAVTLAIALILVISLLGADMAVQAHRMIDIVRASTPVLLACIAGILLFPIAGYVAIRQK